MVKSKVQSQKDNYVDDVLCIMVKVKKTLQVIFWQNAFLTFDLRLLT